MKSFISLSVPTKRSRHLATQRGVGVEDTPLYLKEAETLHVESREDRVFVAAIWRHQMGALPARNRTMAAFRFSLNPQGARGEGSDTKSNDKKLCEARVSY